jgi:GntR family transcriptional regulator, transcriptional repressor for pyruvate dehydrogenase complex
MLWGITPVEAQATYGLAVDRLRGQIHAGLLLPDEKLPAERQLADDFGISRVTLREALRVLETDRYITVRRGAQGGAFVAPFDILNALAVKRIARDPAGAMRVLEFRCANEAASARLAALRRGVPELKRLRAALDAFVQARDAAAAKQSRAMFLLALGDATHNPLLAEAIRKGLGELFAPFDDAPGHRANGQEAGPELNLLRAVFAAIDAQDERAAESAIADFHRADWERLRRVLKGTG